MITYYQQKEGKGNDTNILCPTYLLVETDNENLQQAKMFK